MIRPWFLHWGATPNEIAATDTTDRLVASSAEVGATHAITIHAPAPTVWAWIVQVGQVRCGFYSYDILGNVLFQCDIHSVDRFDPRLQDLRPSEEFHCCKTGPPVTRSRHYIEDGRAIAFSPGWAIVLTPLSASDMGPIVRGRAPRGVHLGSVADFIVCDITFDTVHFLDEAAVRSRCFSDNNCGRN